MERYYRHRREVRYPSLHYHQFYPYDEYRIQISRLYRPLSADYISDSDDEDRTQLLPSHYIPTRSNPDRSKPARSAKPIHNNLSDIWDEREELFGVGRDSDDEDVGDVSGERGRTVTPKIAITDMDPSL